MMQTSLNIYYLLLLIIGSEIFYFLALHFTFLFHLLIQIVYYLGLNELDKM